MPGDRHLSLPGTEPVEIRELSAAWEIKTLSALIGSIWDRPQDPLVCSDMLLVLAHAGNYVVGAWRGEQLVGGLVGFYGHLENGEPALHSYVCAVLPELREQGVGYQLKQHQRRWALDRGVETIAWVFDPLVRRNAYFNLIKLGARIHRYLPEFYGEMPDPINAGDLSDRVYCHWRWRYGVLAAKPVEPQGARPALIIGPGGEPVLGATTGRRFCEIPSDIVELRSLRPERARHWRLALREVLGGALERGASVLGLTAAGYYVLE